MVMRLMVTIITIINMEDEVDSLFVTHLGGIGPHNVAQQLVIMLL